MLKERIAQQTFEPQYQQRPWRASQVGDPCLTFLYHIRKGDKPQPLPGRVRHLLDDGRQHELDIVRRLVNAGFKVLFSCLEKQMEVVCLKEPLVVGHPDGILGVPGRLGLGEIDQVDADFDKGQTYFLLEVTAPNHFLFHRIKEQSLKVAYPQKYLQVQMYLASEEIATYTDSSIVVIKNKNTSELLEVGVSYNEEAVNSVVERLQLVDSLIKEGKEPSERCEGRRHYCVFRHLCFASQEPPQKLSGVLLAESLSEAEELEAAAQMWKEGKALYSKGDAMMEDAREYFRSILKSYGVKSLKVGDIVAQLVSQQRRQADLDLLKARFPEVYREVVSLMDVEALRVTEAKW